MLCFFCCVIQYVLLGDMEPTVAYNAVVKTTGRVTESQESVGVTLDTTATCVNMVSRGIDFYNKCFVDPLFSLLS